MMKAPQRPRMVRALLTFGLSALVCTAAIGCEKDEPPPPLPSAPPAASPEPVQALLPEPIDAAVDVEDEKPKVSGKGGGGASLSKCCAALEQNAASAPEPNAGYMRTAATLCRSAVAAGQTQGMALAGIRAALQTAGMPSACK